MDAADVTALVDRNDPLGWWPRSQREGIRVFGAGGFARRVASAARALGIQVHAFLTSAEPLLGELDGVAVCRADAAAIAACPTWIGVFNREAHSDYSAVRAQLEALAAGASLVWPQAYYARLRDNLGWCFWLHPPQEYDALAADLAATRQRLDDEQSRQTWDRLLAFRRMLTPDWQSPSPDTAVQYMPDWLRAEIRAPLRIVDGGAYRGETLRDLARLVPVEQAWTFEPDLQNYGALVQTMADWPTPITHLPAGLSDRCGSSRFATGHGESSALSSSGECTVPIVALDHCLHLARPNFVKLDVEGHEYAALCGARTTLLRERPILAIVGYHRWDDLWRIPRYIDSLGLDYRIRIGLHGHNSFETVFYAY